MRKQRAFFLISTLLATAISFASAAGEACSATQKCPKDSPCCGVGGTCGSGSFQCAGGCQPMMSFAPSSCLPNPICQDKNITFAPSDYNNSHQFWPILLYNGNSSNAPFTLDYGYLGKGPEGVLLELTEQSQTKISTTDYMLYGNIQLSARHNALAGLVFAFITMSDIKDEIDWEFTTANAEDAQTNYFSQGVTVKGSAQSINASSSVSDWHTYGLNWQENQLQWSIDGNVVRTLTRSQAGTNYPRSPSRVQISVWAGGNSTNPPGVIQWAGGAIDWTSSAYTSPGYYSAEIRSFQTTCASQSNLNETTVGNGNTTTSWVYTGQMSDNEPQFALSNDPISYLASPQDDAPPGLPGYSVQSAFTKSNSNAWDGSGDTSGLSQKDVTGKGSTSNNLNSSGGWLANNRTLSIAVPVVAGAISLAVMWALCVCLFRRYKKRENGNNVLANSGVPLKDGSVGFNNINSSSNKGTRYEALYDDEDEASENEAMYADPTPMGAQRVGKGYGPASGPRPGPMNRQEWSDSSSSLYGADEYAMSEQNLGYAQSPQRFQQQTPQFQPQFQQQMPQRQPPQQMQRQPPPQPIPQSPQYQQRRYPASPAINQFATPGTPGTPFTPYPNGGVRGPYTPGMNAYTPALHQTPAALQASFAPSQVNYNPPQRMNGYDQQCQQSYQRQQQQQQQQYPRYR